MKGSYLKVWRNSAGFSLIEVMVAAGILGIVAIGMASLMTQMAKDQAKTNLNASLSVLKRNLEMSARDTDAWKQTVSLNSAGAPSQMNCLKDVTVNCTPGTWYKFALYDASGGMVFNGNDTTAGFTLTGQSCSGWSSSGTSALCAISYDLEWKPDCSSAANCKNPLIQVRANLKIAMNGFGAIPTGGRTNITGLNVDNYSVSITRGKGNNPRYEPLLVKYIYDATGSPPAGEGTCNSGGVIRRLNTISRDVGGNVSGVTSGGNSLTLKAGQYDCRISAPAWKVGWHRIRLRSTAGTSVSIDSTIISSAQIFPSITTATIDAVLDLQADTTLQVAHYCESSPASAPYPQQIDSWALGVPIPLDGSYNNQTLTVVSCVRTS